LCQFSDDLDTHVVPVIMRLAEPDSMDDFRADAVLVSFRFFLLSEFDTSNSLLMTSQLAVIANCCL